LRIVFAGTPDFAARGLSALIGAGHQIVLVLTQPDRPSGRGMQVHPGPVKQLALDHGIAVMQPSGLRVGGRYDADARAAHERLQTTPHDVMRGCINIHASLLPRWRGAAPIQRAIEAGDSETGITIMQMDAGLDTGDTLLFRKIAISPSDTAGSLTDALADLGGVAIVEALAELELGVLTATPQHPIDDSSAVTYAAKLSKTEAPLDFGLATRSLVDRIRAFDPWPGCSADLMDSGSATRTPFKIWAAKPYTTDRRCEPGDVLGYVEQSGGIAVATGDGAVVLTELQKPGGKRLDARHFKSDFFDRSTLKLTGRSG
jgi:methionyl-tRNA formyltransferase